MNRGEPAIVDEDEALVVEHPSTMMMKDNIKFWIQIQDTLKMTTLRVQQISNSVFLLQ